MSTPESPNHVPPVPRYGEYAPVAPVQQETPGQPAFQPPAYQQHPQSGQSYYAQPGAERPRRTADMVISIVLLVIGFFSVLVAILNAFTISLQMEAIYEDYGIDGQYEAGAGGAIATAVIIISHLVLYVLAVVFTIVLIRKRRISFWLPLSAGVLASIIFIGTFVALILADPALVEVLSNPPA
jgi:hypothetical protein